MKIKLIIILSFLIQGAVLSKGTGEFGVSRLEISPKTTLEDKLHIDKDFLLKHNLKDRAFILDKLRESPQDFKIDSKLKNTSLSLGREGNGGDSTAAEFFEIALKLREQIQGQQDLVFSRNQEFDDIDLDKLEMLINFTTVFSVDYKLCSSAGDYRCPQESGFVAKNFPETLEIHVNETKWSALEDSEKVKIVFHEYLGLLGVEEGTYNISSLLVANISEQVNYNSVSCNFTLRDRDRRVHSGAILGQKHSLLSGVAPLMFRKDFKYGVSYIISTGYLRIEVREVMPFGNSVMPRFEIKPILPEVIVIDGSVDAYKVIETDIGTLNISCMGIK